MNNWLKVALKWVVLTFSYVFLAYKLLTFSDYSTLLAHLRHISFNQYGWILLVFILFPLNIILEAFKWKKLLSNTQQISISQSVKAVFAGFTTGFFTPNRLGEPAGRVLYLQHTHRKSGFVLSYLSGFTQTYVIAIAGLPTAILFFSSVYSNLLVNNNFYFILIGVFLIFGSVIYFHLPKISALPIIRKKTVLFDGITNQSKANLLTVIFLSLLRYAVFSIQFFGVLHFFGVDISIAQAAISIPASYLFVTFTPTMAFSEAVVRSSYAVFFIGAFSTQTAGIAFAGFSIWLINSGIPMIIGSVFLLKTRK